MEKWAEDQVGKRGYDGRSRPKSVDTDGGWQIAIRGTAQLESTIGPPLIMPGQGTLSSSDLINDEKRHHPRSSEAASHPHLACCNVRIPTPPPLHSS